MSPGVPHIGYTYFKILDSPELLQILVTLTTVIKFFLPNVLGRAIVILNFVRRFWNFIAATVPWERANLSAFRTFVRFALFGFICFLFLFVSGKGCGLWLWHFLGFSLTFLVGKYSVSLKTLLQQGISEPEFYGDLVYRFRKNVGNSNFSEQFRKLINRYKELTKTGYYGTDYMPSYQPNHCWWLCFTL